MSKSGLTNAELRQFAVMRQEGFSEIVYYKNHFLDERSKACIVLIFNKKKNVIARGVSICSEKDNFNKLKGRLMARGRALHAIEMRKSNNEIVIRDSIAENMALKTLYGEGIRFKSEFHPTLTMDESAIVERELQQ